MSFAEKGLALAEVVAVGVAMAVRKIVIALFTTTEDEKQFYANFDSFSDRAGDACARVEESGRAADAAFADSMLSRALNGDPIARYHPAYQSREAG